MGYSLIIGYVLAGSFVYCLWMSIFQAIKGRAASGFNPIHVHVFHVSALGTLKRNSNRSYSMRCKCGAEHDHYGENIVDIISGKWGTSFPKGCVVVDSAAIWNRQEGK